MRCGEARRDARARGRDGAARAPSPICPSGCASTSPDSASWTSSRTPIREARTLLRTLNISDLYNLPLRGCRRFVGRGRGPTACTPLKLRADPFPAKAGEGGAKRRIRCGPPLRPKSDCATPPRNLIRPYLLSAPRLRPAAALPRFAEGNASSTPPYRAPPGEGTTRAHCYERF